MTVLTAPRLPGWPKRLEAFIDQVKANAFAWDGFDCGPNWAGRHVEVMTGHDPAAAFRGRYKSRNGALRVMRQAGHDDLADLVATMLPELEHPSQAIVGDIVAVRVDTAFKHALGICNGSTIFVLREDGIGLLDLLAADRAFRVGGDA